MSKQTESWIKYEGCGATCPDDGINDLCRTCRRIAKEEMAKKKADEYRERMIEKEMEEKWEKQNM